MSDEMPQGVQVTAEVPAGEEHILVATRSRSLPRSSASSGPAARRS